MTSASGGVWKRRGALLLASAAMCLTLTVASAPTSGATSSGLPSVSLSISIGQALLASTLSSIAITLQQILNPVAPSVTPTTSPSALPLAPTSVTVKQGGTLPDVVVNWVNSTIGNPATGAAVSIYQVNSDGSTTNLGQITCGFCTSDIYREVTFGDSYEAIVYPTDSAGIGRRPRRLP